MTKINGKLIRLTGNTKNLILVLALALAACVENGQEKEIPETPATPVTPVTPAVTRVLNDSPVNGITYTCDNHTDITSNGGEFTCIHPPVVFKVGELTLGEITTFNADNQVFPQDLAGVGRDNFSDEKTIKIARLLQSLDDDGKLAEAIDIPITAAERFHTFSHIDDNTLNEFAGIAGVELVSKAFAISHLKRSLIGGRDRFDYKVRVNFSNVNADNLIATDVNFTVKGAEVLDGESRVVNRVNLGGFLKSTTLYLRNLPEPGQDIRIIAQADGYLDSVASMALSETTPYYELNLKLVKSSEGKLANGIYSNATLVSSRVTTSGIVTETIVLKNQEDTTKPAIKITIPENTVLTDKNGNPIAAKELKITSFEASRAEARSAFPGGLQEVLVDATGFSHNGITETGQKVMKFKPVSFSAISIKDADGRDVKQFSENIDVKMQFPMGVKNGLNTVILVGDEIPIWSFDEDFGQWRYEHIAIVQDLDLDDGFYDIVYSINHLSYWAGHYYGGNFNYEGETCAQSLRFYISDPLVNPDTSFLFRLDLDTFGSLESFHFVTDDLSQREEGYWQLKGGTIARGRAGTLTVINLGDRRTFNDSWRFDEVAKVPFDDICGADINVLINYEDTKYDGAKEKSDALSAISDKSGGVRSIADDITYILDTATLRAAEDPVRSDELFQLAGVHALEYSAAFIEKPGYVGATPDIYGCDDNLFSYVDELLENFYYQEVFSGPWSGMTIAEVLPYFVTAGNVFLQQSPDQLSYAPYGIRGFVECGYKIAEQLAVYGDESNLQSFIVEHFEGVISINVASLRADIELELANNGIITEPSAATFDYLLSEATLISGELAASGNYTAAGLNAINSARAYYDELVATGKVGGGYTD